MTTIVSNYDVSVTGIGNDCGHLGDTWLCEHDICNLNAYPGRTDKFEE